MSLLTALEGLLLDHDADHDAVYAALYKHLAGAGFRDGAAFHHCIVALIQNEKYLRALSLLKQVPADVHREHALEKAYVYYKLGLHGEVDRVCAGRSERALQHVKAQSQYQRGDVAGAYATYRALLRAPHGDAVLDLACNERAILSQMDGPEPLLPGDPRSYDTVFNEALLLVRRGEHAAALERLQRALDLCTLQTAELLEQAPILLAMAYVHHVGGRRDAAAALLDRADGVADPLLRLVLRTHRAALAGVAANAHYTLRELAYPRALHVLRNKLTAPQKRAVVNNHLLLEYHLGTLGARLAHFRAGRDAGRDVAPLMYKVLVRLGVGPPDLASPTAARRLLRFVRALQQGDPAAVAAALLLVKLDHQRGTHQRLVLALDHLASWDKPAPAVVGLHALLTGADQRPHVGSLWLERELECATSVEALLAADVGATPSLKQHAAPRPPPRKPRHKTTFGRRKFFEAPAKFDPALLDKERWVPKKLRSTYKRKDGRRRRK